MAEASAKASKAAEKRIDPEDGQAYTFDEMFRNWSGRYTNKEIQAYWDNSKPALAKPRNRPSPAALTAQIKSAATIKDVLAIHRAHEGCLNHIHVSACWTSLARQARQRPADQ